MTIDQSPNQPMPERYQQHRRAEKPLAERVNEYPGFPFGKDKFPSLGETLQNFRSRTLVNAKRVAKGELSMQDMPKPVLYVTGLPGVGKTEMVNGVLREYAQTVVDACGEAGTPMIVRVEGWETYEKRFFEEVKKTPYDPTIMLTPEEVRGIGAFMDEQIALHMKEHPNVVTIIDRPGGTVFELGGGFAWDPRPYGATPIKMTQRLQPFNDLPLDITPIGVMGGPNMEYWVNVRDAMIRAGNNLEEANAARDRMGLERLSTIDELHEAQIGGTRDIVDRFKQRFQWPYARSIVHNAAGPMGQEFQAHVPRWITDFLWDRARKMRDMEAFPKSLAEVPESTRNFLEPPLTNMETLAHNSEGIELWSQIQEVARRAPEKSAQHNPFFVLWSMCNNFAGLQALRLTLGFDAGVSGTIVYNNPPLPKRNN